MADLYTLARKLSEALGKLDGHTWSVLTKPPGYFAHIERDDGVRLDIRNDAEKTVFDQQANARVSTHVVIVGENLGSYHPRDSSYNDIVFRASLSKDKTADQMAAYVASRVLPAYEKAFHEARVLEERDRRLDEAEEALVRSLQRLAGQGEALGRDEIAKRYSFGRKWKSTGHGQIDSLVLGDGNFRLNLYTPKTRDEVGPIQVNLEGVVPAHVALLAASIVTDQHRDVARKQNPTAYEFATALAPLFTKRGKGVWRARQESNPEAASVVREDGAEIGISPDWKDKTRLSATGRVPYWFGYPRDPTTFKPIVLSATFSPNRNPEHVATHIAKEVLDLYEPHWLDIKRRLDENEKNAAFGKLVADLIASRLGHGKAEVDPLRGSKSSGGAEAYRVWASGGRFFPDEYGHGEVKIELRLTPGQALAFASLLHGLTLA